jgi:UDP-4-amino-4,6-dideoxy-N-acetyl-beta-L-altrosamine transaminase
LSKNLPYSRQCIEQDDIQAVVEVLKSDFLTQGPKIAEFEKALAGYCGAKYAVTFSSGTAALHGAYFAAGLNSGDEVITSPITFLATANAAIYLGAKVVFVDVESDTGNINADLIEKAITKKTKLLVPVHYSGLPVDMEKILAIAKKHNLILIEDACHALGAKYKGEIVGNCRLSQMAVFSFHPVKSIATGEGGAATTNSEELYNKLVMFRQYGVIKDKKLMTEQARQAGEWYYEMHYLGFNYKLTDIQAALGVSQLRKIERFVGRRREIAKQYAKVLAGNKYFELPVEKNYGESAWHLYPIRLKDKYVEHKIEIFNKLRKSGLWVQVHYIPVYLQPYYEKLGFKKGLCPAAEDFYSREIGIPIYPMMSDEDVQNVAAVLNNIFEEF